MYRYRVEATSKSGRRVLVENHDQIVDALKSIDEFLFVRGMDSEIARVAIYSYTGELLASGTPEEVYWWDTFSIPGNVESPWCLNDAMDVIFDSILYRIDDIDGCRRTAVIITEAFKGFNRYANFRVAIYVPFLDKGEDRLAAEGDSCMWLDIATCQELEEELLFNKFFLTLQQLLLMHDSALEEETRVDRYPLPKVRW